MCEMQSVILHPGARDAIMHHAGRGGFFCTKIYVKGFQYQGCENLCDVMPSVILHQSARDAIVHHVILFLF